MVLDASLLNTQHYKVEMKSKRSNPGKGVAPSPIPQHSSYWIGSLCVVLDYGWPTYYTKYFSLFTCSQYWTYHLKRISLRSILQLNAYIHNGYRCLVKALISEECRFNPDPFCSNYIVAPFNLEIILSNPEVSGLHEY